MRVASIDQGFGDTKVTLTIDGLLKEYFKETNAIVKLKSDRDSVIKYSGKEKDVVKFGDDYYLVGGSALEYPDRDVIKVDNFDDLKRVAPVTVLKYLKKFGDIDFLVLTISIAYLERSGEYMKFIEDSIPSLRGKIDVIPQGGGCKLAVDRYGLNLDNQALKSSYQNYIGVDIGFNTIDTFRVVNGSMMISDIQGFAGQGITRIAEYVQSEIRNKFKLDASISRIRKVIYEGHIDSRGTTYDCKDIVKDAINRYIIELKDFLESKFATEMTFVSNVILFGGGAEVIKSQFDVWSAFYKKEFVLMPEVGSEFYNAIGASTVGPN